MPPWDKYNGAPSRQSSTNGLLSPGNIDLTARPVVQNDDGSISTVRSMSFNEDGQEVLIPTVSPDGRILSDDEAIDLYRRTGQNLGKFDSPGAATSYAENLHNQQDQMYRQPEGPWGRYKDKAKRRPSFEGGMTGAAALGAGDTLSFGISDELGAGLGAASEYLASFITGEEPRSYSELIEKMRDQEDRAKAANPGSFLTGQIAGGLAGGAGLARGGLSATANAIGRGASLGRVAATSAGEGAVLGALQGFGSGEGVDGRLKNAGVGMGSGLVLGGATPLAVSAVSQLGGMAAAPMAARLFPDRYADRAIGEGLRRSNMTADDVSNALLAARADGQDVFTVADALGHTGERMLSTVARTPHNERQAVVEALQSRQAGQGRRLQNALVEGFGAPQTKQQTEAALEAVRKAEAGVNYPAARQAAGSVDPSAAIAKADDFLGTAGSLPLTNIADDSVEGAVKRARSLLTDGDNIISDFDTAFRAKVELDNMIEKATPTIKGKLIPIRNDLDRALEKSSDLYANARDTFRRQSQDIEAAEIGREAAMRGRVEDTIPRFQGMTRPEQQAAFRSGYVDPYIESMQGAAGPMTNKARPLISDATSQEFPAFAAPGRGQQLMDRIGREQKMFETTAAALGNSKTADNIADAADMSKFDPSIMAALMRRDVTGALMSGATRLMNEGKGLPPSVVERLAKALMENDPEAARAVLQGGQNRVTSSDEMRARIISALMGSATAGAGRIAAP